MMKLDDPDRNFSEIDCCAQRAHKIEGKHATDMPQ